MSTVKPSFVFPSSSGSKKKYQNLSSSRNRSSTSNLKKMIQSSPEECIFCNKKSSQSKKNYFPGMINKALYSKYSSSQNYYFTKDINEILTNSRTPIVIKYKDCLTLDEEEDYLKRFYKAGEYDYKIRMLTEYYKFHKDISRMFMVPTTHILNKYHDRKRRLEYIRVTKMLKDENESKNPSPKPKDKARNDEKDPGIMDRILDNLEITNTYIDQGYDQPNTRKSIEAGGKSLAPKSNVMNKNPVQRGQNLQKPTTYSIGTKKETSSGGNNLFSNYGNTNLVQGKVPGQDGYMQNAEFAQNDNVNNQNNLDQTNQSNNHSVSNTIQDLNLKLGEIISNNSRIHGNYFDSSNNPAFAGINNHATSNDPFLNETITNLTNFLTFLKKNPQQQRITDIPEITSNVQHHHRYSNTLTEAQVKQLSVQQITSLPNTHRGAEVDGPPLTQQLTYHSRTSSHSGVTNPISSTPNLIRKPYTSSITTTATSTQHNNFVSPDSYKDSYKDPGSATSPFKENNVNSDKRPQSSAGLSAIKTSTKTVNNFVSKIKNFDEALRHNDQNIAFKIHSSQASQRSISRESKRASGSAQNYNSSGINSMISKTPRNLESGSREPSVSKLQSYNATNINKSGVLTKSTSRLNLKQAADSITRGSSSNLGSTQSSLKSTKIDYGTSTGSSNRNSNQSNYFKRENIKDSSGRGLSAGGSAQSEKVLKKTHSRMNSGNVATFLNNGGKPQQAIFSSTKMALPLTSQNFFTHSNSNANLGGTSSNPQTLRDLKRGTYYEQRRQPASLAGSLSKRDLQPAGQYTDLTKMLTQNNSKAGSTEASHHNFVETLANEGVTNTRPVGMHKYTKSESKYNKDMFKGSPEIGFRMDEATSHRKFFQEGSQGVNKNATGKYPYGGSTQNLSPSKQVYTYNHNNIVNIFLQPNQDSQKDQNIVIKTETDRFGTNGSIASTHQDYPLSGKITSKKVSSSHDFQLINQHEQRVINGDLKHSSGSATPFKVDKKEDYTSPTQSHQNGLYGNFSTTTTNFTKKPSKKI